MLELSKPKNIETTAKLLNLRYLLTNALPKLLIKNGCIKFFTKNIDFQKGLLGKNALTFGKLSEFSVE